MAEYQETPLRIVLLGKSGDGKSSAGNTILGESVFITSSSPQSQTIQCQLRTDRNNRFTVTDTPGLFDTRHREEDVKKEMLRCIIECAPGPHAFVIVLKVGRYTKQEEETVDKLLDLFGEEALKYTMIVFTRGDELDENQNIEDFVKENGKLKSFVSKCGGGCHVIDNKYWRNTQHEYRNNRVQVEKIINTIQKIATDVTRGFYTNDMLRDVEAKIQEEEQQIRQESNINLSDGEIRVQAKGRAFLKIILSFATAGIGILLSFLLRK